MVHCILIAEVQIFKLWLTEAKNTTVGGELNFKFYMLLKSTVIQSPWKSVGVVWRKFSSH